MEYLMTYGWAILIISVVMAALFSLPILNGGAFGTSCLPTSGFYCSSITFPHASTVTNAIVLVTIGQSTGTNWQGAVFAFAPAGISTSNGIPIIPSGAVTGSYTLSSGGTLALPLNVVTTSGVLVTNVLVGTTTTGAVWACYSTTTTVTSGVYFNGLSSCNYVQIATITAKAT
jgi:hypothetical protein